MATHESSLIPKTGSWIKITSLIPRVAATKVSGWLLWQLEICSHMHKIGSFFCVSCRLLGRELQGVIEKALKSSPVFDSTLVSKKNTEGICTCVDFQIFTDNQPGNLCTDNQLHSQGFTPILF